MDKSGMDVQTWAGSGVNLSSYEFIHKETYVHFFTDGENKEEAWSVLRDHVINPEKWKLESIS
jgi:hypothetical protein